MTTGNIGFKTRLKQLMQPQHIQQLAQICKREGMDLSAEDIAKVYNFLLSQISSIAAFALGHEGEVEFDQLRYSQIYRPRSHPGLPASVEVIYKRDKNLPDFLISKDNVSRGSFKKYKRAINLGDVQPNDVLVGIKRVLVLAGEKEKNSQERYKRKVDSLIRETEVSQQLYEINSKYFDCQEYIGTQFYPKPQIKDQAYPQFKEGSMMATLLCKPAICSLKDLIAIDKNVLATQLVKHLTEANDNYRLKGDVAPMYRELAESLLRSVGIMHSHDYKHLDIKPANILLCKDNSYYLQLTDFGRTKLPKQEGHKDASPRWASPQVYDYIVNRSGRGEARARLFSNINTNEPIYGAEKLQKLSVNNPHDHASVKDDMWAVGVVLFELYTGIYPHANQYTDAVLKVNPLLRGLLDPDEVKRFDCKQALEVLDESKVISR